MDMIEFAQLNLRYRGKHDDPLAGKFGVYLGRGDGTILGPKISGDVKWDLFEIQNETTCDANLLGSIRTPDNAEIKFEALGFFRPEEDRQRWNLSSAIHFSTGDRRYVCFDHCIGLMTGVFDMSTYEHAYRLFAPRCGN